MNRLIENPWYTVFIDVRGCGYDLRINDCPLVKHRHRPTSCAIPVNHWLHSGANVLTAQILPLPDENRIRSDARLQFDLLVREDGEGPNEHVASLSIEKTGETIKPLRETVQITVPFPPWNWHSAPVLETNEAVLNSLLSELDVIHGLVAGNNISGLVDLAQERISETAVATYQSNADVAEGLRDSWKSLISEPGFILQPPEKQSVMLWLFGEGRLAMVTDRYAQATIFCSNPDGLSARAELLFRQDLEGKWVICR